MKKISIFPLLIGSLGLTGCSNFLYSNTAAPVYSGTTATNTVSKPAVLGQPSKVEVPAVVSVENPQVATLPTEKALEGAGSSQVIVDNSQSNPYVVSNTVARPMGTKNATAEVENNIKKTVEEATKTTENVEQQVSASAVGDQSVNNAKNQLEKKTDAIVARPTEVIKQKTQQVTEKVEASVGEVGASVDKATETVTKTNPATPQSATKSLLQEARSAVAAGNYDKAASALERAHRIEPGNAKILYDIAQIRYAQGNYVQAQSFASRKALGNASGAASAAQKAASF